MDGDRGCQSYPKPCVVTIVALMAACLVVPLASRRWTCLITPSPLKSWGASPTVRISTPVGGSHGTASVPSLAGRDRRGSPVPLSRASSRMAVPLPSTPGVDTPTPPHPLHRAWGWSGAAGLAVLAGVTTQRARSYVAASRSRTTGSMAADSVASPLPSLRSAGPCVRCHSDPSGHGAGGPPSPAVWVIPSPCLLPLPCDNRSLLRWEMY